MELAEFKRATAETSPPSGLSAPLAGLWWAAKGEWDRAHETVQDDPGREAAWVHAYLHRVEGDLSNAGYWYRQAGKPVATGTLESEWAAIAGELLSAK